MNNIFKIPSQREIVSFVDNAVIYYKDVGLIIESWHLIWVKQTSYPSELTILQDRNRNTGKRTIFQHIFYKWNKISGNYFKMPIEVGISHHFVIK